MPELIDLPEPATDGAISVERALVRRRSARRYRMEPLPLTEVAQLLWAAQGQTSLRGLRTAPSAGATFPLVIYLVAGEVEGLAAGLYRYHPAKHQLEKVSSGDLRRPLCDAALGQAWVREGAAALIIAADFSRTTRRYGERGCRYVEMEAGHAQQSVHLQAVGLGIGTVVVGAFDDQSVQRLLHLPQEHAAPLSIMPLGRIR